MARTTGQGNEEKVGMRSTQTDGGVVQSITRAFTIIETLAAAHGDLGISDLAANAKLPLPTVHRILKTLIACGYVQQTPHRRYALGVRLIPLSRYAGGAFGVALRPIIARYVDELDESISVAMLDQDFARYIAHVPTERAMRMFTEVGNQVSLHATGVGKAILSTFPARELAGLAYRLQLRSFTDFTITEPQALLAEVEAIRARGYAIDDQEHELGIRCAAVAVPGRLRLALSASGPPQRITDEWINAAVPRLQALAAEIAQAIPAD